MNTTLYRAQHEIRSKLVCDESTVTSKESGDMCVTDPELLEIRQAFAIEGAELLADMESALLSLEANPTAEDDLGRLFRAVHTIKGSASIVKFDAIEHFCHSIEHILVRIRDHELSLNHRLITLLLTCHDHVSAMMEPYCITSGDEGDVALSPAHFMLLDQLQEWVSSNDSAPVGKQSYGTLDESYLGGYSDGSGSGLNFFEGADDMPVRPKGLEDDAPEESVVITRKSARNQQVVRVDAVRIDQLSDLVVELVTASSVLEANVRRLGDLASTESAIHVADLIKQIQEKTISFRMVPVQTLFHRFERIIHDFGSSSGKQIHLQVTGGETELDKAVAEKLFDPLLHLVRNAIDHGIEPVGERKEQGKNPTGTIHLQAFHDSGHIIIRVSDDGQGINMENVARKAVKCGLVKRENLPAGKDLLACIFEPGFSTLEDATMISGRGVGMDVVRKVVESIRGNIDVETSTGVGTTFQISIPLSLSLIEGFMVSLGSTLYILPMDLVLETLELPDAERLASMPDGCIQIRHELLPCLDLRRILGVVEPAPPVQHVVVFKYDETGVGLIVDRLMGEIKTVIKPLGHLYRNVTCISGAGILGDGSIALFLEAGKLVETSKATSLPRRQ